MTETSAEPAGRGRLAQVIATRGGLAAPEAPFVIEHREALIYMLCEAAELEHGIMCQYLFAAFSLKQSRDEGLTADQLAAVTRWRKQVTHVATQEMLHLTLVQNLLSAIGAAPHMSRPNLPHPAGHYPAGVQLALLPFGEAALRHFMYLERPETYDIADAEQFAAHGRAMPHVSERDIVPQPQDFATVGHLYRSIEQGFAKLAAKYGERWLFVGPPRAQATQDQFSWPQLVAVTDLASAQRAIDTILEQGEGPRGHWQNAHFGQFVEILDEYEQMTAADPGFEPVRPVLAANVRPCAPPAEMPLITERVTSRVTDLFNVGYEILLQIFERYFAHTEETDAQLKVLADATIALMFQVVSPLGSLITTLPAGPGFPGRTAGPSFELFYESDYLMPHRAAAWALLTERLGQAAWLCREIQDGPGAEIAADLAPVADALATIAGTLAAHLPPDSPQARQATSEIPPPPGALQSELTTARALAEAVGNATGPLADLFRTAYSAVTASAPRPPRTDLIPRLTASVLRPLSDVITRLPNGAVPDPAAEPEPGAEERDTQPDPAAKTAAQQRGRSLAEPTFGDSRQSAEQGAAPAPENAMSTDSTLWQAAQQATTLRAKLASTGTCPTELTEATAALQALTVDLAPAAEAESRRAELRRLQADLPASIQAAANGPYLVTNVPDARDGLGRRLSLPPQLALCRCGNSARKPFCDGSHAGSGFTDAKDPNRVPDRRDSYEGQQVTIFDNRGLCQHAGFCTDRLPGVFRAGAEPFVAPSGGRMDEILMAVRDCPSGALSFAVDGTEARSQTDHGDARPPAIEVSRDGPYRITGGVELTDAEAKPVSRNAGASLEHYALCRCGHSQNKPFCSGMHWYVGFRDPLPSTDPDLYEWAGGLPALTRMHRLLYEKHISADPELAAAFASMPADHAEREAERMAGSFGGPPGDGLDSPRFTSELTEQQRSRWVALAGQSATDAGLPADPEFRAALASYLEWDSRDAPARAAAGSREQQPAARWDWTAAGPPRPAADSQDNQDSQPTEVPMPEPGEAISFDTHIKPLFREKDRQSMSFALDLWSEADVRAHADGILARLRDGSMPCDGAWPQDRIAVFERWAESARQE